MSVDLPAAIIAAALAAAVSPLLAVISAAILGGGHSRFVRHPNDGPSVIRLIGMAAGSAVAAGLVGGRLGWSLVLPAFLTVATMGAPLAAIDVEHKRLPFVLVIPTYVVGLASFCVGAVDTRSAAPLIRSALAAVVVGGAFLVLALAAPGQLGLGDVALIGTLSMHLGWLGWSRVALGLVAGLILGAVWALVQIARNNSTSAFPLGPALIMGWLVGVLG